MGEVFACTAAETAAERAGPQQAAAGRRLLAASEGQLGMLPSLDFISAGLSIARKLFGGSFCLHCGSY